VKPLRCILLGYIFPLTTLSHLSFIQRRCCPSVYLRALNSKKYTIWNGRRFHLLALSTIGMWSVLRLGVGSIIKFDEPWWLGFDSWLMTAMILLFARPALGLAIFLWTTASRTALGPTQPPIQWVPGALSLGVKRPVCEADHSPPSSAEVKEWVELYIHSPNTPSWRGA
jgi:hypothetical protein